MTEDCCLISDQITNRLALYIVAALATPQACRAATPADFQGHWIVARMVGAADAGTGDDYRTLLRTKVVWGANQVTDADGTCDIVHASVAPVPTDTLQHDIWGGQTIAGLTLPKTVIAHSFGATRTPVFDDGGKGCARAVMLSTHQLLLMFGNGYLYVLDRDSAK